MTELRLDWCDVKAARYAVEHWHYSKSMPVPPQIFIGVWELQKYIGCVIFSRGANANLGTTYGLEQIEVCELTRVALNTHITPVSKILSLAIKMLRKKEIGLRLIVSYADVNHEHLGIIYQATNWVYVGCQRGGDMFMDTVGKLWHSRQVSANGVRKQFGQLRRVPKPDDCERIVSMGKHKYLMPLDDAMRKQIVPLAKPYPKRETCGTGETDNAAHSNAQTGGASPTVPLIDIQ